MSDNKAKDLQGEGNSDFYSTTRHVNPNYVSIEV
jgi:hypothetical protein